MEVKDVIGIDPDSQQYVCVYLQAESRKMEQKTFSATEDGIQKFIAWAKSKPGVVIALEGSNGQSRHLEKAMRKANEVYYSFKACDVARTRASQIQPGKNNEKDALATAYLAMERQVNGSLEKWRRVYMPDEELQSLSRRRERLVSMKTAEISSLWKLLFQVSTELYMYLSGKIEDDSRKLDTAGILRLLSQFPVGNGWRKVTKVQIGKLMGGNNYKNREERISGLLPILRNIDEVTKTGAMLIRQSAETLISLKQQQVDIEKELKELSKTRPVIHQLAYNPETKTGLKGIGIITASAMTAEIIHINRFFSNNSLALYCGLGMIEDETGKKRPGERKRMIRFPSYNRRLKYAFITAAKNFVRFNPDHHLSGMYRNLLKKGMTQLEARKRVARALVRMIFRILKNYEAEKIKQEDKGRQIG